ASAPIWAACRWAPARARIGDRSAAISARATARPTTPRPESAGAPRPRISKCRTIPSSPTPSLKSARWHKMSFPWAQQYEPKNGLTRWIDQRLPLPRLVYGAVGGGYPVPRNLNYFWNFGVLAGFALTVQIVTGIVLAMHYVASGAGAFESIEHIMRDVNQGWLLRYAHANGASFFFVVTYIHIFRGLYYGSYKAPRELVWMLGLVILLLMMATAFMGYVLPWGQMSFWGAKVITGLFGAIPLVGEPIQQWLLGGYAPDNAALNRFFSLHFLLPFVIVGAVVLHIWALHIPGSSNPTGIEVKSESDTVPFFPHFIAKDGSILIWFFLPWLDRSPVRSSNYRPLYRKFFWFGLIPTVLVLGYCGGSHPEEPYLMLSQIASLYYFAHFLIILPIVSAIE